MLNLFIELVNTYLIVGVILSTMLNILIHFVSRKPLSIQETLICIPFWPAVLYGFIKATKSLNTASEESKEIKS